MDLLDILNGHAEEVFSGTYFSKLPQSDKTDEAGILFDYEHVDPTSWSYRRMFGNMVNDAATTAIKSCDPIDWKVGGYMRLQDGRTYTIEALQRDYTTRQAFRYLDKVAGTDTVMRLTEVEDPFK